MPNLVAHKVLIMLGSPSKTFNCVNKLFNGQMDSRRRIAQNSSISIGSYIGNCDGEHFDGYWRIGVAKCDKTSYTLTLKIKGGAQSDLKHFIMMFYGEDVISQLSSNRSRFSESVIDGHHYYYLTKRR